jgi:uncharacterized membrane protein
MPDPSPVWFVKINDTEYGPYTNEQLKKYASERRITSDSLVRRGTSKWVLASSINGLFEAAPPQDPPQSIPPEFPTEVAYAVENAKRTSRRQSRNRALKLPLDWIFDYYLDRFLSPIILRIVWVLSILFTIVISVLVVVLVVLTITRTDEGAPTFLRWFDMVGRSVIYAGVFSIVQLIATRVLIEYLIAIFSISESLKRIEHRDL